MSTPIYDGRYSEKCKDGCVAGGCGRPGLYTDWCGGCCECRGGCEAGYEEQLAEAAERTADASQRGETQ